MCDVTCTTAGGNRQPRWQPTTAGDAVVTETVTALIIIWPRGEQYEPNSYLNTVSMLYTCCVHTSIRTSTILAVLFVSPSKIALEKFYVYCPPPLLDEIYAPAHVNVICLIIKNKKLGHFSNWHASHSDHRWSVLRRFCISNKHIKGPNSDLTNDANRWGYERKLRNAQNRMLNISHKENT